MAILTPEQQQQYYASEGNKPMPLSPNDWLAQQSGGLPSLPQGGGSAEPQLPEVKSTGNNLLDFKNAIAAIDIAAKQNRNKFATSLAGAVPEGTLNASSFGDIIQMLNRGGNDYASQTQKNALEAIKVTEPDIYTAVNDNGDVTGIDKATGKVLWTQKGVGNRQGSVTPKVAGPLNVLDIARYNELYPDAGIVAGDTEEQANAKVSASNSPEAKLRSMVVAAQSNNNDYETVVNEINNDATIKDKAIALSIAKEVYGVQEEQSAPAQPEYGQGNFSNTDINERIAQLQKVKGFSGSDVKAQLRKEGYSPKAISNSEVGNVIDQITAFLFNE